MYMEKIKQKLKHLYILGRYPERDWMHLLILFVVIGIVIASWSAFFYFQVKSGVFTDSTVGAAGNALSQRKEKELRDLIARYDQKAQRYVELQKNLPSAPPLVSESATTTASSTSGSASSSSTVH